LSKNFTVPIGISNSFLDWGPKTGLLALGEAERRKKEPQSAEDLNLRL
jgi:hypothetical protein